MDWPLSQGERTWFGPTLGWGLRVNCSVSHTIQLREELPWSKAWSTAWKREFSCFTQVTHVISTDLDLSSDFAVQCDCPFDP